MFCKNKANENSYRLTHKKKIVDIREKTELCLLNKIKKNGNWMQNLNLKKFNISLKFWYFKRDEVISIINMKKISNFKRKKGKKKNIRINIECKKMNIYKLWFPSQQIVNLFSFFSAFSWLQLLYCSYRLVLYAVAEIFSVQTILILIFFLMIKIRERERERK